MNVAVIDSGIDVDHPDLNVAGGVECSGGKGFDDRHGHGTMVAGLIAARDNAIGRVGVASGAPLWAVRVGTSSGDGITLATIICGVDWVTSTRLDSDAGNDIPVANISLGLAKGSDKNCASTDRKAALRLAICRSIAVGVTYVASAGNDSADYATHEPATYDDVLAVTAMAEATVSPAAWAGSSPRVVRPRKTTPRHPSTTSPRWPPTRPTRSPRRASASEPRCPMASTARLRAPASRPRLSRGPWSSA